MAMMLDMLSPNPGFYFPEAEPIAPEAPPPGRTPSQPPVATPVPAVPETPPPAAVDAGCPAPEHLPVAESNATPCSGTPAESVAELAELAGPPGACCGAEADVEVDVPEAFVGFDAVQLATGLARLGQALESLPESEREACLTAVLGFMIGAQVAQAGSAQNVLGMSCGEATAALPTTLGSLSNGWSPEANAEFSAFMEGAGPLDADGLPRDINALVQWVLRQSYLECNEDLKAFAEKVKFYNGVKKQIRAELERARKAAAQNAPKDGAPADPNAPLQGGSFTPANINKNPNLAGAPDAPIPTAMPTTQGAQTAQDAERQRQIDAWNAKPPVNVPSQEINPGKKQYGGSGDYGKFDQYRDWFGAEIGAKLKAMSPAEKEALMARIVKEGGVSLTFNCYESDKTNDGYGHTRKVTPRPGEKLDEYMARAIEETANEFKDKVSGSEGNIDLEWISGKCSLPGYSFKEPMPAGLGTANGAQTTSDGWKPGEPVNTGAELDAYIQKLDEDLASVGDDAQLANVDLQNSLQRQQQVIQMLSNISKMLHDTAQAIIRKIGG